MIVTMKTVSSGTGAGAYYIEGTLDKQLPERLEDDGLTVWRRLRKTHHLRSKLIGESTR